MQKTISCGDYDYIEIACMHRYDVRLVLADGATLFGRAVNTRTAENKQEYFGISVEGVLTEVPMNQLVRMTTTTPGASFDQIVFAETCLDN